MALNDPQVLTLDSAKTLPRTSTGSDQSAYTSADQSVSLFVGHQYGRRVRRTSRATISKITTDPLLTGQNIRVSASARVVLDAPASGFSAEELETLLEGLATWIVAQKAKIVGGEN